MIHACEQESESPSGDPHMCRALCHRSWCHVVAVTEILEFSDNVF